MAGEYTVYIDAEVSDGHAVISEITPEEIDEIIDNGTVGGGSEPATIGIMASQADLEITSVELSKTTMKTLAEAVNGENNLAGVDIRTKDAAIVLDGAALFAVTDQAEGNSISITIEETDASELNEAQQGSLELFDNASPFSVSIESAGEEIHDLKGGEARVYLMFSPKKGFDERYYHVLYIPSDGMMERRATKYQEGWLSFETPHSSDYAIIYDETVPNGNVLPVEMHRLYNPNSGEHFYTADTDERDHLVEAGWSYEGVAWNAPDYSHIPVYRMYNPNAGDHHYTRNSDERDDLILLGWNYEGIGWYSDENEYVQLFRLYNPNAMMAGSHHYTVDEAERDHLTEVGWSEEGIGWYGM